MAKSDSIGAEADRIAGMAGGRALAAWLAITSIFVVALFMMRTDPIFTLPASLAEAGNQDFAAFWRAGRMMLEGRATEAYDPALFRTDLPPEGQGLLFLNPPHFFLLIWPFSLMSYGAAKAVWLALNASGFCAIGIAAGRAHNQKILFSILMLASPAAFAALLIGQASPLIAAAMLAALLLAKNRPLLAGLLLALITVKPQYGFLIPVFLAARGEWRAFAAAAASSIALAGASFLIWGPGPWAAFFQTFSADYLPHTQGTMRDTVTVYQTAGKLGGGAMVQMAMQLAAMLGGAIAVWIVSRRWARNGAIGFTIIATTFVSPSLWVYDWPLYAAGLFMLLREWARLPIALQIAAALLWIAPLISLGLATMESSLAAPVITAAALILIFLHGTALYESGYSTSSTFSGKSPS